MGYKVTVDNDKCIGDGECVDVCPVEVYELQDGKAVPVNMPKLNLVEDAAAGDATKAVRLEIADGELCPVYRARVLTGAKIQPSPAWMRHRLLAVGQRPINNIVDVTNYILMELGQPLHSFDRALLKGDVIRVAPATPDMRTCLRATAARNLWWLRPRRRSARPWPWPSAWARR